LVVARRSLLLSIFVYLERHYDPRALFERANYRDLHDVAKSGGERLSY